MLRRIAVLVLVALLAACNLSVPQVTPTLAPTRTPTSALAASDTPVPTALALLPTRTPISTATVPPTATPTVLPTATNTLPPTVTPLPLIPTDTPPVPTPSFTPAITLTATNTPPPTRTLLPTLAPTRTFSPAELTAFFRPTLTPTRTMSAAEAAIFFAPSPTPAPTLDATPTFITAEAPPDLSITPIQAETTPQPALPTFTASPQPTVALSGPLPPTLAAPPVVPTFIPINIQTRAFALDPSGAVAGAGFSLSHENPTLFARSPRDFNQFASTDAAGNLYLSGTTSLRLDSSPFMADFTAQTREENNAYVSAIAWSPDGNQLAFIVAGRKLADDGIWVFDLSAFDPLQLLVDCPTPGFPGCGITSGGTNPDTWESRSLAWSPQSDALLAGVWIPQENRAGFVILPRSYDEAFRSVRPPVLRYQFAAWSRDGQRILASGAAPDGRLTLEWLDRGGASIGRIFDPQVFGLWMGYANEAATGQIYVLGAPGDASGPREPLRIYDKDGAAVTGTIGQGIPERVEWSPDGSQVFVQTGGRQYVAAVSGSVRDITDRVAGARAINWVEGLLPPSEELPAAPGAGLPSGVIAGSRFQPGQQLRVQDFQLNIRAGPGVEYDPVRAPLLPGEYVAILAGPVNTPDGYTWWRVQAADGAQGWIADAIDGAATLGS